MPEVSSKAGMKLEKVRVYCSQWASCGWQGMRLSDRVGVQAAPCPKCEKEVVR